MARWRDRPDGARSGLARPRRVFDLFHPRGDGSRLPDWYSAACAGYDIGMAAALASDPELTGW
jgi:hypothetical protein